MKKSVKKKWGHELWIVNNDKYCGKELFVRQGKWSSNGMFHYHKKKDETFYVIDGILALDIAEEDGNINSYVLHVGESCHVPPGTKHRFSGFRCSCTFIEFSTHHEDSDSYRCSYDPVDGKWREYNEEGVELTKNPFDLVAPDVAFRPPPMDDL